MVHVFGGTHERLFPAKSPAVSFPAVGSISKHESPSGHGANFLNINKHKLFMLSSFSLLPYNTSHSSSLSHTHPDIQSRTNRVVQGKHLLLSQKMISSI